MCADDAFSGFWALCRSRSSFLPFSLLPFFSSIPFFLPFTVYSFFLFSHTSLDKAIFCLSGSLQTSSVPTLVMLFIFCVRVCVLCVHAYLTSGRLVCVYSCVWVWSKSVCLCGAEKFSIFLTICFLCVCVGVWRCVSVFSCCDSIESKLTSPSPCNSICPSARLLGGYREAGEKGWDLEGVWRQ